MRDENSEEINSSQENHNDDSNEIDEDKNPMLPDKIELGEEENNREEKIESMNK